MPHRIVNNYPGINHIVELTNHIIGVSDNSQHKVKIFIADLPDGIGGFAEGNSIYLSRKTLDSISDEYKITLIAHEYAHIECKHRLQTGFLSAGITGVFLVANYFVPGLGWLNHAVNPMAVRAYTTGEEKEANRKATEYLVKLGYSKYIMLEYLKMCKSNINLFKYTAHASMEDEIKDLENYLASKQFMDVEITYNKTVFNKEKQDINSFDNKQISDIVNGPTIKEDYRLTSKIFLEKQKEIRNNVTINSKKE